MKINLLFGIIFIALISITFISAYEIEVISINPGQMEFQSDSYEGSIIIETPSGVASSDTYETQIGFLYSTIDFEEAGTSRITGGFIRDKGFFEKNKYFCLCIFFLIILCLLIIIFRKKEKEEK